MKKILLPIILYTVFTLAVVLPILLLGGTDFKLCKGKELNTYKVSYEIGYGYFESEVIEACNPCNAAHIIGDRLRTKNLYLAYVNRIEDIKTGKELYCNEYDLSW